MTDAVVALAPVSGMTAAICAAVGVSRATVERRRSRLVAPPAIARPRPAPARTLTAPQQKVVLDLLHAPRFADQAPAEIYATLLDEGVYHCSIRTMYRLLEQNGEVRERRQQLRHPVYQKPELLAEKPNGSPLSQVKGSRAWVVFPSRGGFNRGGQSGMTSVRFSWMAVCVILMSRITVIDGVAVTLFDGLPASASRRTVGLWEPEAEVPTHPA